MKNKKIWITIGILLCLVIGLGFLNKKGIDSTAKENCEISIKLNGEEKGRYSLEDLEKKSGKDFKATLKRSGKEGEIHTYTGILLKDLLKDSGIFIKEDDVVISKAEDGFTVSTPANKVLEDDNVYLAYKMDGEYLKPKEEDGSGPFQLVVSKDQFSQYWCKFCIEVDVQSE